MVCLDPFEATQNGKQLNDLLKTIIRQEKGQAIQDLPTLIDTDKCKVAVDMKRPIKMANKKLKSEGQEQKLVKEEKRTSTSLVSFYVV